MEDGTGLVHTAPAFGAEDMNAALEFDLPVLMTVKEDGTFIQEVRPWSGKFVKDADPEIIQDLQDRGLMFRVGTYTHTYPFCWRCDTPLLYYARAPGLSALQPRRTVWWLTTRRSTGFRNISRKAALATGWKIMSTGLWGGSAIGAHRCRSGNVRTATTRTASALSRNFLKRPGGPDRTGPTPPVCGQCSLRLPGMRRTDAARP